MVKKQKYREGSWVAVPLDPNGFAIGLVARKSRGGILIIYFFDKVFSKPPNLSELETFTPEDAVKVGQVGDLGILNGEWKVIGELPDWNRSLWRIPNFVRREEFSGRIWLVTYSDDNPNLVLSEKRITEKDAAGLEKDSLWGYKSAEKKISKLLG
jgi:hypothetical protein